MRGIYLQRMPGIAQQYDPVKGIEPHSVTQVYLATVEQLRESVAENGLNAESTTQLLADLQEQSRILIIEDPYTSSEQQDTFAKLKRRMRGYMNTVSTQEAFETFWQSEYLAAQGWTNANQFFTQRIQPLLLSGRQRAQNVDIASSIARCPCL